MAQAREHPPVTELNVRAVIQNRWALPQLLCVGCGMLLVVDAAYLMSLAVYSLGATLPLAMGCALAALGLKWNTVQAQLRTRRGRVVWRWMWLTLLAWAVSLALFWTMLARAAPANTGDKAPAAIIVLGSGTPNGKASPTLAARLDVGLQQAARFPSAVVVVSGGRDFSQSVTEAEVMGDYLRARGLAPARILQEDRSTSTRENLLFTKEMLRAHGLSVQSPVQVVTSDFHTMRSGWIARHAGYADVSLVGAPTPLYVRYNAWLREYFVALAGLALREFG